MANQHPGPGPPRAPGEGAGIGPLTIIVGGVLLGAGALSVVAMMLPWASSALASFTGFDGIGDDLRYLVYLVLCGCTAAAGLTYLTLEGVAQLAAGVAAVVFGATGLVVASTVVVDIPERAGPGFGLILAMILDVVVIGAGILGAATARR